MEVIYLIPGPMSQGPLGPEELERRRAFLQTAAFPGTTVRVEDVSEGPPSIESAYEEYLSVPGMLKAVGRLAEQGVDAVIVGCFGDPGVDAARELVSIPVVGPGAAAMLFACALGHRFSIVTVLDSIIHPLQRLAWDTGVPQKLASVRSVGIPVLNLYKDRDRLFRRVVEVGRACVKADGADTLVLGCMTMAFAGQHRALEDALGVPVVNPALAALKLAEALAATGMTHSKLAFPVPPKLAAEGRRTPKSATGHTAGRPS
jgi:allantoin racemase